MLYYRWFMLENIEGSDASVVHFWATSHATQITEILRTYREQHSRRLRNSSFFPQIRAISEAPLCEGWENIKVVLDVPIGYGLVKGSLILTDQTLNTDAKTNYIHHTFLAKKGIDDNFSVIDFTAAQALMAPNPNKPDKFQRMNRPLKRAERRGDSALYYSVNNELAILSGTRDHIKNMLGLEFRLTPPTSKELHGSK